MLGSPQSSLGGTTGLHGGQPLGLPIWTPRTKAACKTAARTTVASMSYRGVRPKPGGPGIFDALADDDTLSGEYRTNACLTCFRTCCTAESCSLLPTTPNNSFAIRLVQCDGP